MYNIRQSASSRRCSIPHCRQRPASANDPPEIIVKAVRVYHRGPFPPVEISAGLRAQHPRVPERASGAGSVHRGTSTPTERFDIPALARPGDSG